MTAVSHMKMLHAEDPAIVLQRQLGDISGIDVLFNHVLLATYDGAEKTSGGIIVPAQVRDEYLYQGQIGLVVKMGPLAFIAEPGVDVAGRNIEVGDWIMFRTSDGLRMGVNGQHCRLLQAEHLKMRVPSPDMVF